MTKDRDFSTNPSKLIFFVLIVLILFLSKSGFTQEFAVRYQDQKFNQWVSAHCDEIRDVWFPPSKTRQFHSSKDDSTFTQSMVFHYWGFVGNEVSTRLDWTTKDRSIITLRYPLTGSFFYELTRLHYKYPAFDPVAIAKLVHFQEWKLNSWESPVVESDLKGLRMLSLMGSLTGDVFYHTPGFSYYYKNPHGEFRLDDCLASSPLNLWTKDFVGDCMDELRSKNENVPKLSIELGGYASDDYIQVKSSGQSEKEYVIQELYGGDLESAIDPIVKNGWVNLRLDSGSTPLMIAGMWCSGDEDALPCMKKLIRHRAEVNARSDDGETALFYAAQSGCKEMVQLLLRHGADVNTVEKWSGKTPLAAFLGNCGYCEDGYNEIAVMLLHAGANVNSQMKNGWTPLMLAVITGDESLCESILVKSVRPNLENEEGQTALMLATERNLKTLVKKLLKKGADPNLLDVDGWNALHYAARYGRVEIAKLLVVGGANVALKEQLGNTPEQIAGMNHHPELAHWLSSLEPRVLPPGDLKQKLQSLNLTK
jgi:hypothetical protein